MAVRAVNDGIDIIQSDKAYDWLGPGAYFWESDPFRAFEWAKWKAEQGHYKKPAVIGAVIDLRHCLDLTSRADIELLTAAYKSFRKVQAKSGLTMPKNVNPKGTKDKDRVLRFLDCAVFRHLHQIIAKLSESEPEIVPFDTVRGMFVEGGKIYSGSGFHKKTHVQIAVRNPQCIKGIFFPLGEPELGSD